MSKEGPISYSEHNAIRCESDVDERDSDVVDEEHAGGSVPHAHYDQPKSREKLEKSEEQEEKARMRISEKESTLEK